MPLRVVLMTASAESDQELIERGWSAATEQALAFTLIEMDRGSGGHGSLAEAMSEAATKADVLIYPMALTADLAVSDLVLAVSDKEFKAFEGDSLFPALRNGVAKYGGDNMALPLGGTLPALLSRDPIEDGDSGISNWQAYDELVQHWDGQAGEPCSSGWAAAMFLWRSVTRKGWLFGRDDFAPLIAGDSYVQALELMVQTHARYSQKRPSPAQIWDGLTSGNWRGGIGFPVGTENSGEEVLARSMPGVGSVSRVLFDPFSPVVSLSSHCRQSAVAKRFITWLSSGETSESVRKQAAGMTVVRGSNLEEEPRAAGNGYQQWLTKRLQTPVTTPTLRILSADAYYRALDQQIGEALDGTKTPSDALKMAASEWQKLTDAIGVKKQLRAWQRAQGRRT